MRKYIYLVLLVMALVGCDKDNSPLKPTSDDNLQSSKIYTALDLVKNDYDFSGISIREGDAGQTNGIQNWGTHYPSIIIIDSYFLSWAPPEKVACVMVHELNHQFGGNTATATAAGIDCYNRLRKDNG